VLLPFNINVAGTQVQAPFNRSADVNQRFSVSVSGFFIYRCPVLS